MDKIAVLIPCRNEEKTIEKVVRDFRTILTDAVVYVYDNASSDQTAVLAKKAGAVVREEYQVGKGRVVRRMFREVDAECYIMVDGDDTYDVASAKEMVRLVLDHHADMVVGDRLSSTYFKENKRRFHNFGNRIIRRSINTLFHSEIRDVMSGYRAFSYEFVKTFPVLSGGFEVETEMTIHALDKSLQVEHVVVGYRDRDVGSKSKLHTIKDGCRVIEMMLQLYKDYRPLSFFSLISLLLVVPAIVFTIPIVYEYIQTGMVPRFPTLIVCGFTVIAAIQSFFTGLLLETNVREQRKRFEMMFNSASDERQRKKREERVDEKE